MLVRLAKRCVLKMWMEATHVSGLSRTKRHQEEARKPARAPAVQVGGVDAVPPLLATPARARTGGALRLDVAPERK